LLANTQSLIINGSISTMFKVIAGLALIMFVTASFACDQTNFKVAESNNVSIEFETVSLVHASFNHPSPNHAAAKHTSLDRTSLEKPAHDEHKDCDGKCCDKECNCKIGSCANTWIMTSTEMSFNAGTFNNFHNLNSHYKFAPPPLRKRPPIIS